MKKIEVSQDTLRQFLNEHDVKLVRLAELMGMSGASVTSCFKHQNINNGVARSFTPDAIDRLNNALDQIAEELSGCLLQFGGELDTSSRGVVYDRSLVEPLKRVGEWLKLTAMLERTLGWSKKKKDSVLVSSTSKVYGHITKEEADRINAELLSIIGVLKSYQVVADKAPKEEAK